MNRTIRIIGVPLWLGQSRRGVALGPDAVRYAGLKQRLEAAGNRVHDEGNLTIPEIDETADPGSGPPYLAEIATANASLAQRVDAAMRANEPTIVLGGDHSIGAGSVAGSRRSGRVGLIWIDAHADYNTPQTSPSGRLHGMPLAALLRGEPGEMAPYGDSDPVKPEEVALIGIRSVDPAERKNLLADGLRVFTMRDIEELSIVKVARQVLAGFSEIGIERIHASFDVDALEPGLASGTGTPVPGGMTYREARLLMEILAEDGRTMALDLVEINPLRDVHNATARVATELAASLFGERDWTE